jgi:hypothetical protein
MAHEAYSKDDRGFDDEIKRHQVYRAHRKSLVPVLRRVVSLEHEHESAHTQTAHTCRVHRDGHLSRHWSARAAIQRWTRSDRAILERAGRYYETQCTLHWTLKSMQRSGSDERTAGDACLAPVPNQQTGEGREIPTRDSDFMQRKHLSVLWYAIHEHLTDVCRTMVHDRLGFLGRSTAVAIFARTQP